MDTAGLDRFFHPVVLSLLAVVLPLQTNFEHQNLNVVLLALAGGASLAASRRRDLLAGGLVGLAAALKVFPVLAIGYLRDTPIVARGGGGGGGRDRVHPVGSAVRVAGLRGECAGVGGGERRGRLAIRGNNQSLFAMMAKYFGPDGLFATGHLEQASHPLLYAAWIAVAIAVAVATSSVLARVASNDRSTVAAGVAASLLLAIPLSPIAWDHYGSSRGRPSCCASTRPRVHRGGSVRCSGGSRAHVWPVTRDAGHGRRPDCTRPVREHVGGPAAAREHARDPRGTGPRCGRPGGGRAGARRQ